MNIAFRASRYGKGEDDYINCPMNSEQYQNFIEAVKHAEKTDLHHFEDLISLLLFQQKFLGNHTEIARETIENLLNIY